MNKCELCKQDLGLFNETRVDGAFYCRKCYDKASLFLRKGVFTLNEAKEMNNLFLNYQDEINSYCLYLKKVSFKNKMDILELLNKSILLEGLMAETLYNKDRSVLTIKEHIELLLKIKNNVVLFESFGLIADTKELENVKVSYTTHNILHLSSIYWEANNIEEVKRLEVRKYAGSYLKL